MDSIDTFKWTWRLRAWLTMPTFGEAWHNNHHAFPTSARHGLEWWQLDITYFVLVMLRATGLISNLRSPRVRSPLSTEQGKPIS